MPLQEKVGVVVVVVEGYTMFGGDEGARCEKSEIVEPHVDQELLQH